MLRETHHCTSVRRLGMLISSSISLNVVFPLILYVVPEVALEEIINLYSFKLNGLGHTPLMLAVSYGHIAACNAILKLGSSIVKGAEAC